uniref:Peptidase S1 domain-containing protein n=1 Tax=Steinernema glaseri TaxID=37863 RepID=A0A1I7ZC81_9BILA
MNLLLLLLCVSVVSSSVFRRSAVKFIINGSLSDYNAYPSFASLMKDRQKEVTLGQAGLNTDRFEVQYSIENVFIHENYDGDEKNFVLGFDIALFETTEEIQFNDYVQPIKLPRNDIEIGSDAISVGYGQTERGVYAQALLEAHSKIRPCDEEKDSKFICFGSEEGNVCSGDSGGPLLRKDKNGTTWQYGVVSYGHRWRGRCISKYASFFTRVSFYCDWIEKTSRGEVKCHDPEPEGPQVKATSTAPQVTPKSNDDEEKDPPEQPDICLAEFDGICVWGVKDGRIWVNPDPPF